MAFQPANCPKCGGELQIPDDREFINCMYCGTTIKVREVINVRRVANIENLKELANLALGGGNYQEAYTYFSKVLEHDNNDIDAWYGKGIAAGWMSTLNQFRMN